MFMSRQLNIIVKYYIIVCTMYYNIELYQHVALSKNMIILVFSMPSQCAVE